MYQVMLVGIVFEYLITIHVVCYNYFILSHILLILLSTVYAVFESDSD